MASPEDLGFCIQTRGFTISEKEIITALEVLMNMIHRLPGIN